MLVRTNQKENERQLWEMLLLRYPYDTVRNHREAMRIFSYLTQYGNIGFDVVVTDNKNMSKNDDGWKHKHINLKEGTIEDDVPSRFNISLKYVDPLSTNKIKNLINEWILVPEHAMSDVILGLYDIDICFEHEFIYCTF